MNPVVAPTPTGYLIYLDGELIEPGRVWMEPAARAASKIAELDPRISVLAVHELVES